MQNIFVDAKGSGSRIIEESFVQNAGYSGFSPYSLFKAGEQGVWYDPSDLTTLYQDAAGTIPVTAVEQPVGLMLDKSKGLVLGPELVTNGDFSNGDTGWSAGYSTLSVSGGFLVITNTGVNNGNAQQAISTSPGKTYKLTCDFVRGTSLRVYLQVGTTPAAFNLGYDTKTTASGTLQVIFMATGTTSHISAHNGEASVGTTNSFDNISVRELPGNHATQTTSTSRPVLSARVNLLTKTEQFDDAVWLLFASATKSGSSPCSIAFSTEATSQVYQVLPANSVSSSYKIRIEARSTTNKKFRFKLYDGTTDEYTGDITTTSSWAEYSFTFNARTLGGVGRNIAITNESAGGVGTIEVRYIDLRVANDGIGIPAYQRVNTATDYDTAGFPHYLRFDGVDDFLVTNSISFTATDKMTVFAGVRKLDDSGHAQVILDQYTSGLAYDFGVVSLVSWVQSIGVKYRFESRGTLSARADTTNIAYSAPVTSIIVGAGGISGDQAILRINGAQVASSTADQGTGNYGNYRLYIGARAGTSLFFNGRLNQLIIRGATSTPAQITNTENYINSKTKAF